VEHLTACLSLPSFVHGVCFIFTILNTYPQSINWHDSDHRSSSAQAYLTPVENIRKNWLTLTENFVSISDILPSRFSPPDAHSGDEDKLGERLELTSDCLRN
jgi:hypothetical protein